MQTPIQKYKQMVLEGMILVNDTLRERLLNDTLNDGDVKFIERSIKGLEELDQPNERG